MDYLRSVGKGWGRQSLQEGWGGWNKDGQEGNWRADEKGAQDSLLRAALARGMRGERHTKEKRRGSLRCH